MINKHHNFLNILSVLILATVLLSACGAFSFQAQAAPSDNGGVGITGSGGPVQPVQPGVMPMQPAPVNPAISSMGIVLLLVGFGLLVLILLLLVGRRTTDQNPS